MIAILLLIGCGALIAVQATVNGALSRSLGLAVFGVVFSAIQLVCAAPGLLTLLSRDSKRYFPTGFWQGLMAVPGWQYSGAIIGVILLCGIAYGFSKAGALVGVLALLLGQLSMGLLIDQFGLLGASVQAVTPARAVGLALVAIGVLLARQ